MVQVENEIGMIPEARDHSALIRPGYVPGQYVSAGPLPHLVDVWRSAAPSIDLLAPDIYFPNFVEWTGDYVGSGNPLFIPEVKLDSPARTTRSGSARSRSNRRPTPMRLHSA
jgi:beta-galactosidase GanA